MIKIDIKVNPQFETAISNLIIKTPIAARTAMQSAMEEQGELAQHLHRQMSGTDHESSYATWLSPGVYPNTLARGFKWEATGLAARSIQGYAVDVGRPEGVGSVLDSFGRVHDSSPSVAPIPTDASDDNIVGVLTMTATYAPPASQSSATEAAWPSNERLGLQAFEIGGSFDAHISAQGEPLTVKSLKEFSNIFVMHLEEVLSQALKV